MKCRKCNSDIPENASFCPACGNRTEEQDHTKILGTENKKTDAEKRTISVKTVVITAVVSFAVCLLILLGVALFTSGDETVSNNDLSTRKTNETHNSKTVATPSPTISATNKPATERPQQTAKAEQAVQHKETSAILQTPVNSKISQTKQPDKVSPTIQVKNGFHKFTDPDGAYYEGNYVNDKKNGKGTLILKGGIKIVGEFVDDKVTGWELVYYPNGDKYEGSMVASIREGGGKYTYANGNCYEGMWKADKKNGSGVMMYANGDVYEGSFVNGLRQDTAAKATFINGETYYGGFNNDQITGQGTWYYSNGFYKGALVNGKREGYGVYEWESGNIYNGNWKNGKRNGQGSFYNAGTGRTDFGVWQDDVLVSAG